jgi:hypothetical protein
MPSPEIFFQSQMEENGRLANQAEWMRLIVATGNLCLATALHIGLAFLGLERKALLLAIWMMLLGIYGVVAGMKLYERETYHRLRVRKLRAKLDSLDAGLAKLFEDVEQEHKRVYPRLWHIRLNTIWTALHALIGMLAVIYSFLCLSH